MVGRIYLIRNLLNGKGYVGQTQMSVAERFRKHKENARCNENLAICRAIRKHGPENFTITEIATCDSVFLNDLEKHFIEMFRTFGPDGHGYNMTPGGDTFARSKGWHHTQEWKNAQSNRLKGKKREPFSEQWKANLRASKKGKSQPESQRIKSSQALKGRKKPLRTAKHKANISAAKKGQNKGKPWTQARRDAETKRKGGA
jgi:group I intron endonuclease